MAILDLIRPGLVRIALVALTLVWKSAGLAQAGEVITFQPGRKQLFLDDHIIEETSSLKRTMHQPRKRGPVLKADIPSDGEYIASVSAPMWIAEKGVYRFVYEARLEDGRNNRYAWAESADGVHWTKPPLGLVESQGSKRNNLFPTPEGLRLWHVVYDPDDSNPRRRYKGFLGARGRRPVVSADGLDWEVIDAPTLPSGDAGTLTYDRVNKQFLGMLKFGGRHGRSYNITTSKDFVHWSEPRLFFETDELDQKLAVETIRRRLADPGLAKPLFVDPDPSIGWRPPAGRKLTPTWRAECYNIGVFPYEGVYMAWLMIFHPTGQRLPEWRNADGFHLIQLAMTRDLHEWTRLGDRQPFIGPSRLDDRLAGNYDRLQLMVMNRPVEMGDELWFYYTGMKRRVPQHSRYSDGSPRDPATLSPTERADWIDDTHSAICLAVLRRDGFVSLDAGGTGGYLLTKPLRIDPAGVEGQRLYLNLDAGRGGKAEGEVLDATGKPLPGFSRARAEPVIGDAVRLPVQWAAGTELGGLANQTVRLRIHLTDAELYAFWIE